MSRRIGLPLFVMFVFAILGLLHYYIGAHVIEDLPVSESVRHWAWVYLLFSFVLMPFGLLARGIEPPALADRLAWMGLSAMGFLSSLLVLSFVRDLSILLASWLDYTSTAFLQISASAVVILAALATVLGLLNALRPAKVVEVKVPYPDLPPELEGIRIAQISDIHVGPTIKRGYLQRIVERVNALNADIVAVTGDLVDGSVARLSQHTAPLAQLKAQRGVYFVTGNHEYYAGAHEWIEEVRRLGLRVLLNEHVILDYAGQKMLVAGVTDYSAHQFDPAHRSDPHAAMAGAPADAAFKLLLAHQPRSAPAAASAGFNLLLTGHTHGGQFLPWNLFVPLQQPFVAGLHKLQDLWVYVSRGTGYWGPPKRLGAPSEITCLQLVRAG